MAVRKPGSRVVKIKPVRIGPSSVGMTIPKWWLNLNNSPERLELTITLDKLIIRPPSHVAKEPSNGEQ